MQSVILSNFEQLDINFKKQQEEYLIDLDFIRKSIEEDSEFGRLCLHLFVTERHSKSIVNRGYYKYNASSFSCLLHDIHHALYDDGEITFYLVDDEPRLSCEYDFELKDCLSGDEKRSGEQYNCEILNKIKIDDWIKLSEDYSVIEIKSNFLFDYQLHNNPELIKCYEKYKCFDLKWLEEIK